MAQANNFEEIATMKHKRNFCILLLFLEIWKAAGTLEKIGFICGVLSLFISLVRS